MHSPGIIVIETKRRLMGDEHPDFSGPTDLVHAKKAAKAAKPDSAPDSSPDSTPDEVTPDDLADLAAVKRELERISGELVKASETHARQSRDVATIAECLEGHGDSEKGYGTSKELKPREDGPEDY